jgi:hypothetical protein
MEYIINTLQNVSDKLLLKLNLYSSIWHQQRIRYRHLYSLNIFLLFLIGVLIAILYLKIIFLHRRNPIDSIAKIYVLGIYYFIHIHMNYYYILRLFTGFIVVVSTRPSTSRRRSPLRINQSLLLR